MPTIRENVVTMLRNRGYEHFEDAEGEDGERIIAEGEGLRTPTLIVFFPETPKIGIKTLRDYRTEMVERGISSAIVVIKEGLTSFAKNTVDSFSQEAENPVTIEIFAESQFYIDIVSHELQPHFEVVSPDEASQIIAKYKVTGNKAITLPKILGTDPVARYYGLRKGDLLRITRLSETAGEYVSYRVCTV